MLHEKKQQQQEVMVVGRRRMGVVVVIEDEMVLQMVLQVKVEYILVALVLPLVEDERQGQVVE